jgi:hypothetical protein
MASVEEKGKNLLSETIEQEVLSKLNFFHLFNSTESLFL